MEWCKRCYISKVTDSEKFCPTCKQSMQRDAAWEQYLYRETLQDDGPQAAARERDVQDYLTNDKPGHYES